MSVQELVRQWSIASSHRLNDIESKQLLKEAGISVADTQVAKSADEAAAKAKALGLPVVLKPLSRQGVPAQSPDGARVVANTETEVRHAFDSVKKVAAQWDPASANEGVAVQKAVKPGVELRLHVFQDPVLGAAIAFSFGRLGADIWEDMAYRIIPLNEKDARLMLREPKAAKRYLQGYGMLPAPNAAQVEQALIKLSKLVDAHPDITDIELDPAVAGREGMVVQEARVTLRAKQA